MGAAKGNQNALGGSGGKKGRSGRRSAYAEHRDALWHEKIWKDAQDVDALEQKITGKKYAGRDMAALKLLQGDKYVIGKFMDKLVPDLHEHSGPGGTPLFLPTEILGKNKLNDRIPPDTKSGSE